MAPCLSICLGGIGSGLVTELAKPLLEDLKMRILHFLHRKENVRDLKRKLEDLNARLGDVERSVEEAQRRDNVIKDEVNKWLHDVTKLNHEVKAAEEELAVKKGCFTRFILYCCDVYKMGKQASEERDDANKLLEISVQFQNGNVSTPREPPSIEDAPMGDFKAFDSTKKAMARVMDALNDGNTHLIGIYGMGGVGKTTLMEHIGRKLKEDSTFDTVITAVVSQNPNIDQIRREIADQLGMRGGVGVGDFAARKLAHRLRQEKKVVILLDDIWERLDLKEVGIPYGHDLKDQGYICKILLTSRKSQVCDVMEAHVSVLVDVLSPEDSWSLFRSKAGEELVDSPDVEPVAQKVAGECGGLPLALVVVGRALRGCQGRQEWLDALFQLKRCTPTNLEGVEEKLFKSLELSYQHLRDPKVKTLFLYCCLFREDYDISEDALTQFVMGESLVVEVNESLEAVRSSVRSMIKKLKASCLVQDGGKMGCIKLHDVVRDVAVYIASRDDKFLVKAGLGMRDWPEGSNLENCTRISLSNNDISTLPQCPNRPLLVTLLLNINPLSNGLPANFFDAMAALRVLDLSETDIRSLPSSIAFLTNLTALCLNGCRELRHISYVRGLTTLKMLQLQKCKVQRLPDEIGNLVNLRLLDLSHSVSLIIPYNLLHKLSRLEELYMSGCKHVDEAIIGEIVSLQFLARLELFLGGNNDHTTVDVILNANWENLTHFFVYNIIHWSSLRSVYQKNLYLNGVSRLERPKYLLSETEDLQLNNCKLDLIDLASLDEPRGFNNLKKLDITRCDDVKYLLKVEASEQAPISNAYCELELLKVVNMKDFVAICSGMLPANSFRNLRKIHIEGCKNVNEPVSEDLLKRVNNKLQDLSVIGLDNPKVILSFQSFQQQDHPVLPNLRALKLQGLKALVRIWCGVCSHRSLQNLSSLDIYGCHSLEHLFFQKSGSTHSQFLPLETFRSLKMLRVSRCGSLKYIFSPSIVNKLQCLEVLEVIDNAAMEEIITIEDDVLMDEGAFPALKDLSILKLPNMNGFYQGETHISFSWTSLRSLKLGGCPILQRLPIGTDSAPHLKNVHLVGKSYIHEMEWFRNLEWSDSGIPSRFKLISEANN